MFIWVYFTVAANRLHRGLCLLRLSAQRPFFQGGLQTSGTISHVFFPHAEIHHRSDCLFTKLTQPCLQLSD